MSMRRAFTLVEMLLVVAVISLLIALLLPNLSRAKGIAEEHQCIIKMRGISNGFQQFAMDHLGALPAASHGGWQGAEDWQKCWIGREGRVPGRFDPPADGPLVRYIGGSGGGSGGFFRCPSLTIGAPGSGLGSNGGFDFTMFLSFGGARIKSIPMRAKIIYMSDPFGPTQDNLRTPVLIEEDPAYHCNSISIEPGFGSIDRSAVHHASRSSNYVALDGGADSVRTTASRPPQAWEWFVSKQPGVDIRLNAGMTYGDWKTR